MYWFDGIPLLLCPVCMVWKMCYVKIWSFIVPVLPCKRRIKHLKIENCKRLIAHIAMQKSWFYPLHLDRPICDDAHAIKSARFISLNMLYSWQNCAIFINRGELFPNLRILLWHDHFLLKYQRKQTLFLPKFSSIWLAGRYVAFFLVTWPAIDNRVTWLPKPSLVTS